VASDDGGGSAAEFDIIGRGAEEFAKRTHRVGFKDGVADAGGGGDEVGAGFDCRDDVGASDPDDGLIGGDFGGFAESGETEAGGLDERIDEDGEAFGIGL
jgi:hypothetical protein